MASRRSHLKSRNGCYTCKRRRVKCDESGPPCSNCKIRGTDCSFPPTTVSHHIASPASSNVRSHATSSDISAISSSISSMSTSRHIPELRLMHRWSTITCESMVSKIADDREVWRNAMPEVAMKYDFLLNSMFALASFHLAYDRPHEAPQHLSAALDYQTLAFKKFRGDLEETMMDDVEAHDALLYCSIILMVLALASSTQPLLKEGMIQNTIVHFELVRGITVVMLKRPECIKEHRLFCKIPDMMRLPKQGYSPRAARAMQILTQMNESRAPISDEGYSSPRPVEPLPEDRRYLSCKNALWWLEYHFSTCGEIEHRGFVLAWLSLAGDDFIQAIKEGDQISLLAVMWWGVFLNPLGEQYWYGEDFGRDVANEVVEAVKHSSDPNVGELIYLAEQEFREDMARNASEDNEPPVEAHEQVIEVKPFWEVDDPDDPNNPMGNAPASVIAYTRKQNSKLFGGSIDRLQVAERLGMTRSPSAGLE
ncbi:hypothetical protein AC579_3414 [Pseudocercospora musae]|uniref:Zn(2)-C6 fungal-type domain-containing protein n=1 Tax=Pseudocercospora musae TaxID=113226 RepID=A0A139ILS7_9PEZI|nr:hypothetical protein AC579_3414 [Pseudocercospora musae]